MKFKIDENLSKQAAEILREKGYDTYTVNDEKLSGIEDDKLIEICRKEKRCLITADLDFADIISYPPDKYLGIVVIRHPKMIKRFQLRLINNFIEFLPKQKLKGKLWIVEADKISKE